MSNTRRCLAVKIPHR